MVYEPQHKQLANVDADAHVVVELAAQDRWLRRLARSVVHSTRRLQAWPRVHIGQFSSARPLSRGSGYDRGTPIDRGYIDQFFASHSQDIRGRVLEVGSDHDVRRYGRSEVTSVDILHIDLSNPTATIVGDLGVPGVLPGETFDCVILTQTLQYVFDLQVAMKQVARSLRPGGVALITVPGLAPVCPDQWKDNFYWRFTEQSLRRVLEDAFEPTQVSVRSYGNIYAATFFLHGAAVEEAAARKLVPEEAEFGVVITARAVKL